MPDYSYLGIRMKNCFKFFISILLLSASVSGHAQGPIFQYIRILEKQIPDYVKGYDSVILLGSWGFHYTPQYLKIEGYGIKDKKVTDINITFESKIGQDGKVILKSFEKTDIHDPQTIDSLITIPFSPLMDFDIDSLNQVCEDMYNLYPYHINVIYAIKGIKSACKYSYVQHSGCTPSIDLTKFINVANRLEKLSEEHTMYFYNMYRQITEYVCGFDSVLLFYHFDWHYTPFPYPALAGDRNRIIDLTGFGIKDKNSIPY